MRPRTLASLAAALAALAGAWALSVVWQRRAPAKSLLWPDARNARRVSMSLSGVRVELARSGESWELTDPFRFKADKAAVQELLSALAGASLSEELGRGRFDYFGVADLGGLLLRGTSQGEKPGLEIIVGKQGSDYDSVFVRKPGEEGVREARGLYRSLFDKQPGEWADKAVCEIPPDRVLALEIRRGGDAVKLARDKARWRLSGAPALSSAAVSGYVEPMLSALSRLEAESVDFSSTSLKAPELSILVKRTDGSEELLAGPKTSGRRALRKKSGGPGYFVADWKLEPFLKKPPAR
jgi:hypothetical protein